jgi:hypothetical protein
MDCKSTFLSTSTQHRQNHNHLPQLQNTQHSLQHQSPPDATHAKKQSSGLKPTKKILSDLIKRGDIDITNTTSKNIKAVRKEYFSHCTSKKKCCNFCNFAASLDLKTKYSGARQCKAGEFVNHPAIRAGSLPVSQVANLPGYYKIPNKT